MNSSNQNVNSHTLSAFQALAGTNQGEPKDRNRTARDTALDEERKAYAADAVKDYPTGPPSPQDHNVDTDLEEEIGTVDRYDEQEKMDLIEQRKNEEGLRQILLQELSDEAEYLQHSLEEQFENVDDEAHNFELIH